MDGSGLLSEIVKFVGKNGPCELNRITSAGSGFVRRFNEQVRTKSGKNDGSFKRWLLTCRDLKLTPHSGNKCWVEVAKAEDEKAEGKAKSGKEGRIAKVTKEDRETAEDLATAVVEHVKRRGSVVISSLGSQFGGRFNQIFYKGAKKSDGSWKRWLRTLTEIEVDWRDKESLKVLDSHL